MPWKNGGGTTIEIARFPPGDTLESFDWRISTARIEAAGAFSRFVGTDRTIAILDGAIELSIAGRDAVVLDRESPPFAFSGDLEASAALVRGPVLDFNVMTRREGARHRLVRVRADGPIECRASGDTMVVVIARGAATAGRGCAREAMSERDALLVEAGESGPITIEPHSSVELFVVDIDSTRRRAEPVR